MNNLQPTSRVVCLFVDESGNLDFSPSGTKYFVLSCISTFDPLVERDKLISLRYQLLSQGVDQKYFHASEYSQQVRDKVFNFIKTLQNKLEIHSVIAQKNKANPSLYDKNEAPFYQVICRTLLQYVFRGSVVADKIVVVLGALFTRKRQSFILQTLKEFFKKQFNKTFYIYFCPSSADLNCQIADYCSWAIYRKWESKGTDTRSYALVNHLIKSEFEVFSRGEEEYYDYKK